jgi:hypothetical protein
MRWKRGYRSRNVEDRRHQSGASVRGGSLLPLLLMLGRSRIGLTGVVLFVLFLWLTGIDPLTLLGGGGVATTRSTPATDAAEEELVQFVGFVLDDAQATWSRLFAASGDQYREAKLVLFRDTVRSACGFAQAASGPFYCPGDDNLYIDLSFYEELRRGFGAPGDFAQAYVLAHEVGHHVQNLMGIEREVRNLQRGRPDQANALSVRMELQADCLAGVWGHYANRQGLLETGDLEEGLNAAAAIGDDRIQRGAGQRVNPDLFTHGSAAQRVEWLQRGFEAGDPAACDTFREVR